MMLVRDCLGNVTSGPMAFKYTLTILHACKSGAEKVMEVLNEMMQEGLPPDNIICSAIILACASTDRRRGKEGFC